ncbi:MAG: NAD(P)-binding domain-containing protein [Tetragenococcus koreensis]|nr:NAD(P)-binding domain-containing protein [Tetragenococcus koreensis]
MKVGVIGLGNMGYPMAENILQAGHELVVYNRTASKADPLVAEGATQAMNPSEVAFRTDVVFTVLAGVQATEQVVFGEDGILNSLPKEGIHIAISTISVDCAKKTK